MTATQALTPVAPSQGSYRQQGSRFLAFLHPVDDQEQVEQVLRQYRTDYADSRHVCYAYRLGSASHSHDAGEPAHSAGAPILRALLRAQLDHALCIVVRYFGGTKLGIPGLIAAYTAAADDAIAQAQLLPYIPTMQLVIHFAFAHEGRVRALLRQHQAIVVQQHFDQACQLTLRVPVAEAAALQLNLSPWLTS